LKNDEKDTCVFSFYPEELKWSSYDVKRVFPYRYDVFMYYQRDWDAQHYYFANHLNELAKNYGFEVVEKAVTNGTELVSAANILVKDIDLYYAIQDNTVSSYFPT